MSGLREGERIHNYLLQTRLGAGGCGEVWRAKHHVLGDVVAIKVPIDERFGRQLRREGLAAHRLKHPNIVRVIDLDPYATPPYLVMEFVDGPSLHAAIDHYKALFPVAAAVTILRGVLSALRASHAAGLVHRDVKPGNILLHHPLEQLESIPETAVKVGDFGLGLAAGASLEMMQSLSLEETRGRDFAGTVAYMSPEQREGLEVDARSDLYSCGIVLFEMLTGERPQGSELPSELRPGLPQTLDEIFQRCYVRSDRRFGSAEKMLEAVSALRLPRPLAAGVRDPRNLRTQPARRAVVGDGMTMVRCASCGITVNAADKFCIGCGGRLVAGLAQCRNCGGSVEEGDRFCIRCGMRLADSV